MIINEHFKEIPPAKAGSVKDANYPELPESWEGRV